MRASAAVEKQGLPAVAIVAEGFMRQGRANARALRIDTWIAEYPGVIPTDSLDLYEEKVRTIVLPSVINGFASRGSLPMPAIEVSEPEMDQKALAFAGTLDEVQEYFDQRLWSDGLPIVPPTPDRVRAFLDWTDRDRDEVLGVLPPALREATVWSVAVNGVMAGCLPQYMPVLVAAVEAICEPEFRIQDAGSTPSWEPLLVLSGEIIEQLNLNVLAGAMKIGRRANSTLGRFLRLYIRNIAGFRIPPGLTDKGSIGFTFNVALGENEARCRQIGWPTFGVDRGFAPSDNAVTVQSVVAISPAIYSGGSVDELLDMITYYMTTACGPFAYTGARYGHWYPLLVLSPSVALRLAEAGRTKDDIRQHLYDNCKIEAHWYNRYPMDVAGQRTVLELPDRVADQAPRYFGSDDPNRLVPVLLRPEWTSIVVAGDPGRNQSRIYVNNHEQGIPVSKRVALSTGWTERVQRLNDD